LQLSKLNELKLHRSEWRISSNKVLGEGGFGKVVPGILRNRSNFAVKIIKDLMTARSKALKANCL